MDQPFKEVPPDDLHLFRMPGETYNILFTMAKEDGINIEETFQLRDTIRFAHDSLDSLEEHFDQIPVHAYRGLPQIELNQAGNRRAEV